MKGVSLKRKGHGMSLRKDLILKHSQFGYNQPLLIDNQMATFIIELAHEKRVIEALWIMLRIFSSLRERLRQKDAQSPRTRTNQCHQLHRHPRLVSFGKNVLLRFSKRIYYLTALRIWGIDAFTQCFDQLW